MLNHVQLSGNKQRYLNKMAVFVLFFALSPSLSLKNSVVQMAVFVLILLSQILKYSVHTLKPAA